MVVDKAGRRGLIVAHYEVGIEPGQYEDSLFRWRWYVMIDGMIAEMWTLAGWRSAHVGDS